MFDGSTLPLEENLRLSAELLEQCRALDVVLEIECGVVGGEEDGIGGDGRGRRPAVHDAGGPRCGWPRCSAPASAGATCSRRRSATSTGYTRRATCGCARRSWARARTRSARAHPGARFQYVFHGSSGSSPDELRAAVAHGVVKVNLDSEAQYAFTRAAAGHMFSHYDGVLAVDGGVGDKRAYDPRAWGAEAEAGMAARVAQACELLGSAGRSILA